MLIKQTNFLILELGPKFSALASRSSILTANCKEVYAIASQSSMLTTNGLDFEWVLYVKNRFFWGRIFQQIWTMKRTFGWLKLLKTSFILTTNSPDTICFDGTKREWYNFNFEWSCGGLINARKFGWVYDVLHVLNYGSDGKHKAGPRDSKWKRIDGRGMSTLYTWKIIWAKKYCYLELILMTVAKQANHYLGIFSCYNNFVWVLSTISQ